MYRQSLNNGLSAYHLINTIIAIIIIIVLVFFAYEQALDGALLTWDTEAYVVYNSHIHAITWENIQWMLTSTTYMLHWHPLTWFTHALDFQQYQLDPWGHHFNNILLHCFNSIWLFILTILLIRLYKYPNLNLQQATSAKLEPQVFWVSTITAILFAVHPQHVEAVAWVAERKELLSGCFFLLTIIFYIFYSMTTHIRFYVLSLLCFMLALMSKPLAVTIPVLLLLLDLYPLNRCQRYKITLSKIMLEKLPFMLITCVIIIVTMHSHTSNLISEDLLKVSDRIYNVANNSLYYFYKFLFPIKLTPFQPFIDYNQPINQLKTFFSFFAIASIITTSILLWLKNKKYWLIVICFYAISASPIIGLIQAGPQVSADRYAYVPTLGFYIITAGIIFAVHHKIRYKLMKLMFSVSVCVMIAFFVSLTRQQTLIWNNDITLWEYSVRHTSTNPTSLSNLAASYLKAGHYEQAIKYYNKSLPIYPNPTDYYYASQAHIELKQYLDALRHLENVAAYYYSDPAMTHNLPMDQVFFSMALINLEYGHRLKGIALLQETQKINPNHVGATNILQKIQ